MSSDHEVFTGRREDMRLVTGQGVYTADNILEGQFHAAFLRADLPHARIVSIDANAALEAPGVRLVLTGKDALEANLIAPGPLVTFPGVDGMKIRAPARYALSTDRVRFVGEPVAIVVADSADAAADAIELISIEYEELPAVVGPEAALDDGAPQIFDDVPGNLVFLHGFGDEAATDAAFASATHISTLTVESQRVAANPMELKSFIAAYDPETDGFDVYSASQGTGLADGLARFTGHPPEKVRHHMGDVGGSFGIRGAAYPEYAAIMLAAKKLCRPVRWTASRTESFLADYHGRAVKFTGELALGEDGKFLAIRMNVVCDLGAYHSPPGALINILNPMLTGTGCYRIPTVFGLNRLAFTNTSPIAAYRGAGRPDINYMVERLVDQAAVDIGMDRVEIRRRNLIPDDAYPYQTPTTVYDSGSYMAMIEEAVSISDWKGFEARREQSERQGNLRGIGMGIFIEPSGGGHMPEETEIRFEPDGTVTLYTLSGSAGQGHETVFPQLVAKELGIDENLITLRANSVHAPHKLKGAGTMGSRSMASHGASLTVTSREVVRKGFKLAADALEASENDIEFDHGHYKVAGTNLSISLMELAARNAAQDGNALDTLASIQPERNFPGGVHVAEVEIDPGTGETRVISYIGVDDAGHVINHTLLEGQMHGGLAQGAGQVFGEQIVYDGESGQLLTATFMDYFMPRADFMPTPRFFDMPAPSPTNVLGAKGGGEAGTTGALPTLMNAVMDALRRSGVKEFDMPATPYRVWAALNSAGANV
ncbi:xanthine dehydrogenase family protein molybdopterin-binding subunit [Neorhizobium petrolearium]|uniref:Xanthine dehydrogenase family protein molybdopterin-binding subunit n=2 Tax=Neorhizobium TaxID=1525371 RepID=A0ABY8LX63_9HYPH|nr:xanthine dehydrogenase family protein molybdopterin-binding subunit [Neorhizobium petrolearium]MCC2611746.1 xanthine dehydrogenase family protein molybdopterin-binding subunit [Neorhizobium petrolearium]WGI66917.1 xanthine dehydrogenase family protein molybdopterin-binding subunit [Neorhizobium petrolearium]